jgi:hypothetical protein
MLVLQQTKRKGAERISADQSDFKAESKNFKAID